jgi:acetylornithine/N-succinyldiaminopimelate aminotransferase
MKHILECHDFIRDDIVRGDNCYLYDRSGKRYVDFESGIWCTVLGHSHAGISRAIREQIDKVIHLGHRFTNYQADEAALALLDTVSETDGKCVFLSSGSEAVEFAINAAKLITGRSLMLTFSESYLGAYGFAGMKDDNWIKISFDGCYHCKEDRCHTGCANLENSDWVNIGAFVFEPGSSHGKVKFPPEKLVRLLVDQVRKWRGLAVVNEVTTGLGRTGKWYGYNHYGIRPDIIAVGKGLGNGYPVSAVVMEREIAAKLENKGLRYVQSHQNDPLGCAIAAEVIRTIREEDLLSRSQKLGSRLTGHLAELKNRFSFIKEVRGRGLMAALELSGSNQALRVEAVGDEMLQRGFIVGVNPSARLLRFLPPLTLVEVEIENMLEDLAAVLEKED